MSWFSFFGKIVPQAYAAVDAGSGAGGDVSIDLGQTLVTGITGGQRVDKLYQTPADLVNLAVNNLMIAGGLILFVMIILAGFKFLQDTQKGKEEAKKILTGAIIGFVVMFVAYWVVQIVEVVTGADIKL